MSINEIAGILKSSAELKKKFASKSIDNFKGLRSLDLKCDVLLREINDLIDTLQADFEAPDRDKLQEIIDSIKALSENEINELAAILFNKSVQS